MIADDAAHQNGGGARDLFDRRRRALRRARHCVAPGYIDEQIATLLTERMDDVARKFDDVLLIGARNGALIAAVCARATRLTLFENAPDIARRHDALSGDEDRLPVKPEQFDLIIWAGGMDSVNDVPGALLRCRLALRPDGLLIGAAVGDGSFPLLRQCMAAADAPRAIARMHPQLSLQSIGDILQRCGFAMIVTDVERRDLAYRSFGALITDVRAAALSNVLAGPPHHIGKGGLRAAATHFAAFAREQGGGEPRTVELVKLLLFSGWAPAPSQPRPARRGSATASLAAALAKPLPPQ